MAENFSRAALALLFSVMASSANAFDSLALTIGNGLDDTLIQSGDISTAHIIGVDGFIEAEFPKAIRFLKVDQNFINVHAASAQSRKNAEAYDQLELAAVSALWRWRGETAFADAGIGLAYLSEQRFEEVKMGSKANFVLDFALGVKWSANLDISLRYRHYSNGYTESPNPGLDFLVLQTAFHF